MREGLAAEVPEGTDTMKTLAVELVKNEVKHAHEEVLSLNGFTTILPEALKAQRTSSL
jgi:hypothetical protein